ncbi:MAG: O-acetyl-ADP-ribose deacetylase [Chloroflexota bacterium]
MPRSFDPVSSEAEREVGDRRITLVLGDISTVEADAIVNAANEGLRGGSGVDGAIHRAAGPDVMKDCRRIGRCPTGTAVVTHAGRLHARYIIHAVAPIWRGGTRGEPELLAGAYDHSMALARDLGLETIVFPSLGTGAYGYPIEEAAPIALRAVNRHLRGETTLERATFVLFSPPDFQRYREVLKSLTA